MVPGKSFATNVRKPYAEHRRATPRMIVWKKSEARARVLLQRSSSEPCVANKQ